MRPDLNKLLCERERYGHDKSYGEQRSNRRFNDWGNEGENFANRESMKKRYDSYGDRKSFSENLNPLYGAIRKAVGRKWDKFYSELCENFDKRSVINQHILDHLFQYVAVKGMYVGEDGKLWIAGTYFNEPISQSSYEYYVDPRDGILKFNANRITYKQRRKVEIKNAQMQEQNICRRIDDDNVLHLIDGVWFHFKLKKIPKANITFAPPFGVTEFKVGSDYIGNQNRRIKTWDELNNTEKARFGRTKVEGFVRDEFIEKSLYIDGSGLVMELHGGPVAYYPGKKKPAKDNKYHTQKKTASHKMLKKAGLV